MLLWWTGRRSSCGGILAKVGLGIASYLRVCPCAIAMALTGLLALKTREIYSLVLLLVRQMDGWACSGAYRKIVIGAFGYCLEESRESLRCLYLAVPLSAVTCVLNRVESTRYYLKCLRIPPSGPLLEMSSPSDTLWSRMEWQCRVRCLRSLTLVENALRSFWPYYTQKWTRTTACAVLHTPQSRFRFRFSNPRIPDKYPSSRSKQPWN